MDIFGSGGNEGWGESDQIIVNSKISLGEASKLHIIENGDCSKRAYMLIRYGTLEGRFGSLMSLVNHDMEYEYEGRWIVLLPKEEESLTSQGVAVAVPTPTDLQLDLGVLGSNPSVLSGISCFSDGTSGGESLSLSQKELAERIENLSKSNKLQKHTDLYTALRILQYLEPVEKKEALEGTRGYFISNAIISQGMGRTIKGVYEHIDINWNKKCTKIEEPKNEPFNNDKSYKCELLVEDTSSRKDKWVKGIWGEVQGQLIRMEEQENSPKKFEVNGGAVVIGFDVMTKEDIKIGVLGQFNRNWIKQDKNKGEINNNGLGIYAGINKGRFDAKTMLLGSISEYEMTRVIRLGFSDEAKGKTNGINGNLDMEIRYKVPLWSDIQGREVCKLTLRPYTGVTATIVNTKGYKETGMYSMRLDVKENNYFKSSLRAGVRLTGERRSFKWDISAGVGYVAAGRKAKIDSKVIDTDVQVPSSGIELGKVSLEVDIAGGYSIKEGLDIYANADIVKADNYRTLSGNIGVNIRF
ncbi:MAG: autotransporter outer membrane beta-barrel domain-containing protein [Endomicrobium sp.]|jgi:outer membrane autotransporter protein|nr:autotransporter outer membrane beta-barrel domain-containing protein [Endomicrobium sp.]